MFEFIIEGIVTGLVLSILIGPVFFVLIQTSIRKGVQSAMALDAGVFLSDLFYVSIALLFFKEVQAFRTPENTKIAQIIGGVLFFFYGIFSYYKKAKPVEVDDDGNIIQQEFGKLIVKGFVLNMLNPSVIFYWFTILAIPPKEHQISFVATILITYFSIDLLKILAAKKLRSIVNEKFLTSLNHFIGIIFLIFGVFLAIRGIYF